MKPVMTSANPETPEEVGEGVSTPSELQETGAHELPVLTAEEVADWIVEIEAARKREKDFLKEATDVVKVYEAEKSEENPFNILFSNTETLAPALFSSPPVPVVSRRFKDDDPVGLSGAETLKRCIQSLLDTGDAEYPTFEELIKAATLCALVPGRGVTRFEYHAELEEGSSDYKECVIGKEVPWDRFIHGYGKTWKQVPWVAYEHRMTEDDVVENFGEKAAKEAALVFTDSRADNSGNVSIEDLEAKGTKLATVYELWDKTTKTVHFFSDQKDKGGIKSVKDPLQLSGFFNCPRPMMFTNRVSGLLPIPPYKMYKDQAEELNEISVRIKNIVKMMKVRGMYDSSMDELKNVLNAPDGTLEPIQNVAALYSNNGGGLDSAIWLVPIEKLVTVLQQLYTQRGQIKQVIYEITGISDILRGASAASETATAQNIKNQWGTLRLKSLRREVDRYVRECMRIMGEISAEKFSVTTLQSLTNLKYPMDADKKQIQLQLAQQQQQQMVMQQQQQQMQAPGMLPTQQASSAQPPMQAALPVQPTPEQQQILSMPSWEDVLKVLHDEVLRNYKIDIETNSTIDPETSEDQKNISDLLNGLSQIMNGMAPLIQSGEMPFEVLKNLLLVVSRRYTFGSEIEDQLKAMKQPPPPPPPQPDPMKVQESQMKMQEFQMKMQAEAAAQEASKAILQLQQQVEAAKASAEMAKIQAESEKAQLDLQLKREEHLMKQREMAAMHQQKLEQLLAARLKPQTVAGA